MGLAFSAALLGYGVAVFVAALVCFVVVVEG